MLDEMTVLPKEDPIISTVPRHAILFSILLAYEQSKPWVYNNFIQIHTLKNLYNAGWRTGAFDFYSDLYGFIQYYQLQTNPWLQMHKLPLDFLQMYEIDIVNFIKQGIKKNTYFYIEADPVLISVYQRHLTLPRELFIYGYSDKEQCFFFGDNILDGKYTFQKMSYVELTAGYHSIIEFYKNNSENEKWATKMKWFLMLEFTEPIFKRDTIFNNNYLYTSLFTIDPIKISNDINEYLLEDGYALAYRHNPGYSFGIHCYDELIKCIEHAKENCAILDIRAHHFFYSHKKLMLQRLQYLEALYPLQTIVPPYQILVTEFERIISLTVKLNISRNNTIYDRIVAIYHVCKHMEVDLLRQVVHILMKNQKALK